MSSEDVDQTRRLDLGKDDPKTILRQFESVNASFRVPPDPLIIAQINEAIERNTPLEKLVLKDTVWNKKTTPALAAIIASNQFLSHIDFEGAVVQNLTCFRMILGAIEDNGFIREMGFSDMMLEPKALRALSDHMSKCEALVSVDLAGNVLTKEDLVPSFSHPPHFQRLCLNRCSFGKRGKDRIRVMQCIAHECEHASALCELELGECDLDASDLNLLIDGIGGNMALTTLDLHGNIMSDKGAVALASYLRYNESLQFLSLWGNEITPFGLKNIVYSLRENTTLGTLEIGKNLIGDDGAVYVKELIHGNRTISFIGLASGGIEDTGIIALSEAIADNSPLKELDLRRNPFGLAGLMAIEHALAFSTSMQNIFISDQRYEEGSDERVISLKISARCERNRNRGKG